MLVERTLPNTRRSLAAQLPLLVVGYIHLLRILDTGVVTGEQAAFNDIPLACIITLKKYFHCAVESSRSNIKYILIT